MTSHILSYDLMFNHERDTRPSDVERIVALTDEQLANLRGYVCPECSERDCQACCERCGDRHGDMLEVKADRFRQVCLKCQAPTDCACGCGETKPKYLMVYTDNCDGGGEWFTEECSGVSALENW